MNDLDTFDFALSRADHSRVVVTLRKQQDSYTIDDVIDGFRDFLAGCGYSEETIKQRLGGR